MRIQDLTFTSLDLITGFRLGSGEYMFAVDELQKATISQSQDKTEITGKAGRKLSTLKRNKAIAINGTNGLVSGGLLEAQTGSAFEDTTAEILWTDNLVVTSAAATTTWTAIGTTGAEIEALYVRNEDGTMGELMTQKDAVAAGVFTYSPATKALAFNTDVKDGTEVVVCYKRKVKAFVHENKSDHFSEKCTLYIDGMAEDKCGNIYRVQIIIPKADVSGDFSLDMGDSQTVHSFDAESLAGACGAGGNLWTFNVFGAEAEDVA